MSRHPLTPAHTDDITIELMRLMDRLTPPWERCIKRYDQLLDAGLPTDEAAEIACIELGRAEQEREAA